LLILIYLIELELWKRRCTKCKMSLGIVFDSARDRSRYLQVDKPTKSKEARNTT
jgi:hypothetical protein